MSPVLYIRNASRGRRPEWVAVVRDGAGTREVYLHDDLIAALVVCEILYPKSKPEVRT